MRCAASLRKKRQTLSLPPTCTQLVHCEKGKFSLEGSFSKNAPYKQKIIFHLRRIDKMSQNFFYCLEGRAVVYQYSISIRGWPEYQNRLGIAVQKVPGLRIGLFKTKSEHHYWPWFC